MENVVINTRMAKDRKSLCNTFRTANVVLEKPTPEEWERSIVARKAIMLYRLNNAVSISDVESFIDKEMLKIPSISAVTFDKQKAQIRDIVLRCLDFDGRRWNDAYSKEFRFGGEMLKARPDYWLESKVVIDGKELVLIEVNTLSASKPKFGSSPRTGKNDNVYYNLTTLGNLLYGKALLGDREGLVRVEYDYLKTSYDKGGDYSKPFSEAKNSTSFSKSGENNRLWMEVWFSKKGHILDRDRNGFNPRNPNLFKNYKVSLEAYLNGCSSEDIPKGTCEKCELYDRCKGYSKRPEPKPENKVEAKPMTRDDFDISDEQRRVIDARNGIFCIDAGPGSGKTFSVSLRIADMIVDGASPEDFLLLSFSKAAVEVMKERVGYFLNEVYMMDVDISNMMIATFNSIGDSIVKENYKLLGFSSQPELIDDVENIDIIRKAIDWSEPIDGFDYTNPLMRFGIGGVVPRLEKIFADIRQFNWNKQDLVREYNLPETDKVWETYQRYVKLMKDGNFIDYSDQSNLVEELIRLDPTIISDKYDYEHIIVDEFQDSNDFQMLLINTLQMSPSNMSLMVIGDEGQSIYQFRGTDASNLVNFDTKMGLGGSVRDLTLTINRRSTPEIVELSNRVIDINPGSHKVMTSANPSGAKPRWKAFEKDVEAKWVAEEIDRLIQSGVNPSDIAFIAHRKKTLNKLQGLLSEKKILALFDQPEEILSDSKVKAILSLADFLRDSKVTKGVFDYLCEVYGNDFIKNPDCNRIVEWEADNLRSLLTTPTSDKDKKGMFINLIKAIDDGTDNLYRAFVERIEGKSSYNSFQLLNYLYKFRKYESTSTADKGGKYEAVALVTAHSSKGKEWKHVFVSLSDFDSGLLKWSEFPEKIRLAYVAITRAEEFLTVTCCKYRETEGDTQPINRFWNQFRFLEGFEDISKAPEDVAAHKAAASE